jgi:hypothetical protein
LVKPFRKHENSRNSIYRLGDLPLNMRSQEEWAPVFGWRVRDVAHLMLNKKIEDLLWTDDSGANLVIYPWWNELFAIIKKYEGIDIHDVPLFNNGYGGPNPSSQIGGVNAVFIGAMIRLPFQSNARQAQYENHWSRTSRADRKSGNIPYDPEWAKTLADDFFTIDDDRIEEMILGFKNLRNFMDDYPHFPQIIQADGNHPDYHEDIEPTMPIDFLIGNDGWDGEIIDKR